MHKNRRVHRPVGSLNLSKGGICIDSYPVTCDVFIFNEILVFPISLFSKFKIETAVYTTAINYRAHHNKKLYCLWALFCAVKRSARCLLIFEKKTV